MGQDGWMFSRGRWRDGSRSLYAWALILGLSSLHLAWARQIHLGKVEHVELGASLEAAAPYPLIKGGVELAFSDSPDNREEPPHQRASKTIPVPVMAPTLQPLLQRVRLSRTDSLRRRLTASSSASQEATVPAPAPLAASDINNSGKSSLASSVNSSGKAPLSSDVSNPGAASPPSQNPPQPKSHLSPGESTAKSVPQSGATQASGEGATEKASATNKDADSTEMPPNGTGGSKGVPSATTEPAIQAGLIMNGGGAGWTKPMKPDPPKEKPEEIPVSPDDVPMPIYTVPPDVVPPPAEAVTPADLVQPEGGESLVDMPSVDVG